MRNPAKFFLVCFIWIFVFTLLPAPRGVRAERGSDYVVNASTDQVDLNPGDGFCLTSGGNCSLRAAIQESNAYSGANKITFSVPTVVLNSPLPVLSDTSGGTTIYGAGTVYILGTLATPSPVDGFVISTNGNKIQGGKYSWI